MNNAPVPIRLLISDVDGTLVTADKVLTPASIAAVARLREAGVQFAVTSSRPPRGLDMLVAPLGLTTPRAAFNGGVMVDQAGAVIEQHLVPEAAARQTIAHLDAAGVDVWLFADGEWLLRDPEGAYVPRERRAVGFAPVVVDSFEAHLTRAGKIVGVSADFPLLAQMEAELGVALGDAASAHRSQHYYLDVTNRQATKGHAARALAAHLGVELVHTACIGDMANDVPMFEVAGLSIAMGNAPDAVKARADVVTASNNEDGFAAAVLQFVLPRAPVPAA